MSARPKSWQAVDAFLADRGRRAPAGELVATCPVCHGEALASRFATAPDPLTGGILVACIHCTRNLRRVRGTFH